MTARGLGVLSDLDQLVKVGLGDICEANQGLPELPPLLRSLLILEEQLKLLLNLPMKLFQVVLSLPLSHKIAYQ